MPKDRFECLLIATLKRGKVRLISLFGEVRGLGVIEVNGVAIEKVEWRLFCVSVHQFWTIFHQGFHCQSV